jgi:GT2 family glycosyltransferase/glycosyltransferase involved in cell wall biosynthesis
LRANPLPAPKTKADREGELARSALLHGQALLDGGEGAAAVAWLRRALRYAPGDPTAKFSLATALLAAHDSAEAATLFAEVAQSVDLREAWLGAAMALQRLRRPAEAARAIGACLSRHRWDGRSRLVNAVAEAAGAAGWCALAEGEHLVLHPPRCVALADGVAVAGRRAPPRAAQIRVLAPDGRDVLGSPIDVARIRRADGLVHLHGDGLEGWAWHPNDAGRDPLLLLSDGRTRLKLTATDQSIASRQALARPRGFAVPPDLCAQFAGPVSVTCGPHVLAGSPLDPGARMRQARRVASLVAQAFPADARSGRMVSAPMLPVPAALVGNPAHAPPRPERPVTVVVPVYRGVRETLDCLRQVGRTVPPQTRVVVVNDASPEPPLAASLRQLAQGGAIDLLELPRNRGFPAAANAGMRHALGLPGEPDVVLLNSDTLPAPGWLQRLRAAVHGAPDIGTASPLSNDATILSYPDPLAENPAPRGAALARLGRLVARANPHAVVDVPTTVGFCMYLRRECLAATGVFREDVFAQGYGEENDFCRRASSLGWRHVAVPGAYVAHLGGRSFGPARAGLIARNLDVLELLHPGYGALVRDWMVAEPLLPARRHIDMLLARPLLHGVRGGSVLLVTHGSGGGVEQCVQTRCRQFRKTGVRPIVLRSVLDRSGRPEAAAHAYLSGSCQVEIDAQPWANLRFQIPAELPMLAGLLRRARPGVMEVHHLLGHDHAILGLAGLLGIPYEMHAHDYAAFCPRINLVGAADRYCGEPDLAGCEACIADLGNLLDEPIGVRALVARSVAEFQEAARVVAPSRDAAARLRRHFPGLRPVVEPHEPDSHAELVAPPRARAGVVRVCIVGAIGIEKGFEVLLGCARDAVARALPLRFCVVGHTIDDERLLATGCVEITGPYAPGEAHALIHAQGADFGFLPSIWPETWCLTLGEAWRAGLAVAAFDIGAPAERIRATGRGWLLPLGLSSSGVNNTFVSLPRLQVLKS